jgi:hypothetical protein
MGASILYGPSWVPEGRCIVQRIISHERRTGQSRNNNGVAKPMLAEGPRSNVRARIYPRTGNGGAVGSSDAVRFLIFAIIGGLPTKHIKEKGLDHIEHALHVRVRRSPCDAFCL